MVVSSKRRKSTKNTPPDQSMVPQRGSCATAGVIGTLRKRVQLTWTIEWTNGSVSSCVGVSLGAKKKSREASDQLTGTRSIDSKYWLKYNLIFSTREVLEREIVALDETDGTRSATVRSIVSSGITKAMWHGRAPDEPTHRKKGALVHPMLYFSAAFCQRLLD
jgi:hypothetical protein